MKPVSISSPELIRSRVCLVDGLTRTGKSLVCQLFPAFEGMEHPHFLTLLEQILPMMEHQAISTDAAKALIRLHLNEFFCDYILARKANFRPNELTSIFRSLNPQKFFENLNKQDKPENLQEFEKNNSNYFSFMTHDILTHFDLFKALELPYQIVTIYRDPIDTVWSWYKRGWGTRFTEDSRSFTTLVESDKEQKLPWWCLPIKDLYDKSKPIERCILMHNLLLKRAIYNTKNLTWNNGILVLKFEDVCQNPIQAMHSISKFLNLTIDYRYPSYFEQAEVPRSLNPTDQTMKLEKIESATEPKIFKDLITLHNDYHNSFHGISDHRIKELSLPMRI